ncbi:unnamed protein product [marine sediment metagenome]|uniref:Uncharacterized protein n=1 Tax=marine sediment metagenome TaxID=412755 RepID=X0SHB3_9ZZZZ
MNDPTESIRRDMVYDINSYPSERELLEKEHGKVYSTSEVCKLFEITGFMTPFVVVRRLSDDVKGTLMFQDMPRYYFNFKEV